MRKPINRKLALAAAFSIGLAVSGCAGMPENRSVYSVKQPVVERTSYTLDVNTDGSGLPVAERQRVTDWFETMDLRYGDRVSIDDPLKSPATYEAVTELANRYGVLLSEGAPVTAGHIPPGQARLVLTRSTASVPGCPDWSVKSEMNYTNGVHPGYGCAVNSNMAAMIANPEDLLKGQEGTGETYVTTYTRAIETYRENTGEDSGNVNTGVSTGGN